MTASRASVPARSKSRPSYEPKSIGNHNNPARARANVRQQKVKSLPRPTKQTFPSWLKFLFSAQKLSIISTVLLTIALFGIYGWTVYAQEDWNDQYRKLEHLKRNERQLTAAQETIDHNLTTNIQKAPGQLTRETPQQSLFLEAAPLRPNKSTDRAIANDASNTADPLGY